MRRRRFTRLQRFRVADARSTHARPRVAALCFTFVLLATGCAQQPVGSQPQSPAPGPMPEIDGSVPLPTGSAGSSAIDLSKIIPADPYGPPPGETWRGAFRIECDFSHMNYDDAIVFPGQPGRAHLHTYFGNTGADASSTAESIATSGNSTCEGGIANRSAYWVPAMIETGTGRPIAPTMIMTYYKTGFNPAISNADIQEIPPGLRMIAGDQTSDEPTMGAPEFSPERGTRRYFCKPSGASDVSIPNCGGGEQLTMAVSFPQCWDGENLDSDDHKGHMTYPHNSNGCPGSHPVVLPHITFNIRYDVPEGTDTSSWRLSSDMYPDAEPAGYSGHGDFFNGWDPSAQEQWLAACVTPGNSCG